MKLAEALQERADLNRNIEQLRKRLNSNVLVQEGRKNRRGAGTAEAGAGCVGGAAGVSDLQDQPDQFPDKGGWPDLNGADRKKGCADPEDRRIYKDIVYTGSQTSYRARNTEIKIKAAISVTDWQDEIDKMAKELRLLDNKLQENNWSTELIE